MDRYMPATDIDSTIASLWLDTEAPLDELYETAAYRINAVTQLLEGLVFEEGVYSELARVSVMPMRESCEELDVIDPRGHPDLRVRTNKAPCGALQ